MIEYLSSRHSQFTYDYVMYEMTRPQLMIWYEKTAKREQKEMLNEQKQDWSKFANLMSLVANMAAKKKFKPNDFMPKFEEKNKEANEELIKKAKDKGLKTPSNY